MKIHLKPLNLVTGPMQIGKTTYQKKLCASLNVPSVYEYTKGTDVTKPNWWLPLQRAAKESATSVLELHLQVGPYDVEYTYIKDLKFKVHECPNSINLIFILPSLEEYLKRLHIHFEPDHALEIAGREYAWYLELSKRFKNMTIIHE